MAATVITALSLAFGVSGVVPTNAAVEAATGALITMSKGDQKHLIILENSNTAATATAIIKKGNGIQGVADLSVTLAPSAKRCIVIESGKYKNVSGDNKGKISIVDNDTTATTLKVGCIILP